MSRGKRKPKPRGEQYLAGARWQDLVYGDGIVTRGDLDRARRGAGRVAHRCRECPFTCRLVPVKKTLRCVKCGGVLDPVPRK